jgi:hypothetical protein
MINYVNESIRPGLFPNPRDYYTINRTETFEEILKQNG